MEEELARQAAAAALSSPTQTLPDALQGARGKATVTREEGPMHAG
jgi:hypothetical protein